MSFDFYQLTVLMAFILTILLFESGFKIIIHILCFQNVIKSKFMSFSKCINRVFIDFL